MQTQPPIVRQLALFVASVLVWSSVALGTMGPFPVGGAMPPTGPAHSQPGGLR